LDAPIVIWHRRVQLVKRSVVVVVVDGGHSFPDVFGESRKRELQCAVTGHLDMAFVD
jgi:hypothetical protein